MLDNTQIIIDYTESEKITRELIEMVSGYMTIP